MKGTYALLVLAIVALLVWVAQKTPFAFLGTNSTDFVGGFAVGLVIAGAIAFGAKKVGTTTPS